MATPPTTVTAGRRRADLDLIRVAIVGGLTLYHTACVFVPGEFYVSNTPSSYSLTLFVFYTKLWAMPLLFFVAGAGIWYALRTRSAGAFVRQRLRRLLVPLVVGILVLVPPQLYYALRFKGHEPQSYWHFLGRFFDVGVTLDFPSFLRGADPEALFELGHLWFLYFLLVYSLLLMPLFLLLRRDSGRPLREWLVTPCRRPWGVFVLALPILVVESSLGTWGPGGWNEYAYLAFLFYGFLMASDRPASEVMRQRWKPALLVGIVVLPLLFVIAHYGLGGAGVSLGRDHDPWSVIFRLLKAMGGLAWTFAILWRRRSPAVFARPISKQVGLTVLLVPERIARAAWSVRRTKRSCRSTFCIRRRSSSSAST
jgi:glucans biosynthesis protein C